MLLKKTLLSLSVVSSLVCASSSAFAGGDGGSTGAIYIAPDGMPVAHTPNKYDANLLVCGNLVYWQEDFGSVTRSGIKFADTTESRGMTLAIHAPLFANFIYNLESEREPGDVEYAESFKTVKQPKRGIVKLYEGSGSSSSLLHPFGFLTGAEPTGASLTIDFNRLDENNGPTVSYKSYENAAPVEYTNCRVDAQDADELADILNDEIAKYKK